MTKFKDLSTIVLILMSIIIAYYSFWLLLLIFVGYALSKAMEVKRNISLDSLNTDITFDDAVERLNRRLNKFAG